MQRELDTPAPEVDVAGGEAANRLWRLTEGRRATMSLVIAAAILSVGLEVSVAGFIALIASASLDQRMPDALFWAAILLLSTVTSCMLQMVASLVSHRVAIDVQAETRLRIGAKLRAAPLGRILQFGSSNIRRLLMEDVERTEDGIAHLVPDLAAALVAPLIACAVMFVIDWRLASATLLPLLLGFAAFSMIMRRDDGLSHRFVAAQAAAAAALHEAVTMIPVIKAYGMKQEDLKRVNKAFADVDAVVTEWLSFSLPGTNWFYLATTSTLVVVLPLGLWLYPLPEGIPVLAFFTLSAFSLSSVNARLFGAMSRLRIQDASLARIDAFLALPDLPQLEADNVQDGFDIRIENMSFSYGDQFSLKTINLYIREGQKVALVGPSGSGKSTVARLLLRFFDPDGGRITLGDRDIRSLPLSQLSNHMTAVFQDTFLFSRSVRDNIALGKPDATPAEIEHAASLAQAHDFIGALPDGYDTVLSQSQGLSGGHKQRIAIARAILKQAPIIILDEATAYADPESQYDIQQALSELGKGRTVIAIAHRLSTITDFDHIVYFEDGRIVESGTHAELLTINGGYARQWRSYMSAQTFSLTSGSAANG